MSEKTGFVKAEKRQAKLRLALIGPSGSGKTFSALAVATGLANGGKIAVIDTEHASASLYADIFNFDVKTLDSFNPAKYVEAIQEAESAGYGVIIVDSLSHAWAGTDGALEMHNEETVKSKSKNSYLAWRNVTPVHNAMVEKIVGCKTHIICTMRSKMEYVQEKDEATGKTVVRKIGMQPIQREGFDYEFSVVGDLDQEHNLVISKSRCRDVADSVWKKPGKEFADKLVNWLNSGKVADPEPPKIDQFAEAIKGIDAGDNAALDYLISIGWLKKTEKLNDLSSDHKEYIIANVNKFKAAVCKWIEDIRCEDIERADNQRKQQKEMAV
jgi:hypothetical protein